MTMMEDRAVDAAHHEVDRALRREGRSTGAMADAIRAVAGVIGENRAQMARAVARERLADRGGSAADAALRIASDVSLQFDPSGPSAQREGRFERLGPEDAARVRHALDAGWAVNARDRAAIEEAARRPGPAPDLGEAAGALARDLGIGPSEWTQPGQRGDASYLLHVQLPAILSLRGVDADVDPANRSAVTQEADNIRRHGAGGPNGVQSNLRSLMEMADWSRPAISPDAEAALAPSTGLPALEREAATLRGGHPAAMRATGMGMAA